MVDETAYRETLQEVNDLPCIFTKALFFGCCECQAARCLHLAEL
jgi:hypothetical protein